MIKFRRAMKEDREELIRLIQIADNRNEEVARKKVIKYMQSDKGFFILATKSDRIIAYLLFVVIEEDEHASEFFDISNYSCVCWVAVHPDFRNDGIGSKLLSETLSQAEHYNKKGLWLDCRKSVLGFYGKNGFVQAGKYLKKGKISYVLLKEFE